MFPVIFNIYGPLKLNSYSLMIMIGILVFIWFLKRDKKLLNYISSEDIINIISETGIIAIIGGRLLYIIIDKNNYNNFYDIISIWNGGVSILGSVIFAVIYLFYILHKRNIEVIKVLDIFAVYVPIIHAISRVGCFLAGCCYGIECNEFWAVTYTNPDCVAPLNLPLHPTQIYSSILYFIIFAILYYLYSKNNLKDGILFSFYLIFMSIERITIDFLRADRDIFYSIISKYQIIASFILLFALILILFIQKRTFRVQRS